MSKLRQLFTAGVVSALGVVAFGPGVAQATFTRPFLCQITSLSEPRGVSVDAEDHLWVVENASQTVTTGDGPSNLFEFDPAYSSCGTRSTPQPLTISGREVPSELAIERTTGRFYVSGPTRHNEEGRIEVFDTAGLAVSAWNNEHVFTTGSSPLRGAPVAIDNSTDPGSDPSACGTAPLLSFSECFVYVSHAGTDPAAPAGDGLPPGIEKLTPSGEPAPFSGSAPYISGNEITGTPASSFASPFGAPGGVAVDPNGDIFAINPPLSEVDEYRPSGIFVRAFTGAPGGGSPTRVAVDPVSGHLLVSLDDASAERASAIDEFDIGTGRFLSQSSETPESHLKQPFDIATDSHGDVYVVDEVEHAVDVYGPGHFLPDVAVAPTTSRTATTAVVHGSVTPEAQEGFGLNACRFEYTTQQSFVHEGFVGAKSAECNPAASQITSNSSPQPVQATLSGLTVGGTYYYRLAATSEGPLGGTATSSPVAFTTPAPPGIDADSITVSHQSATSVELEAKIAPRGAATTYRFQYVSDADYRPSASDPYELGASAPVPAASLGAGGPTGSENEAVQQRLGGLAPGTTYHFRVVAESVVERVGVATTSADHEFTTLAEPRFTLPDNRAYELVTPARKVGGSDMFAVSGTNGEFFNHDVGIPAESGEGFLLGETLAAFGSFPSAEKSAYVFRRTGSAWNSTSLAAPDLGVQGVVGAVADPIDLSKVAFNDVIGSEVSEAGAQLTSVTGPPGGPYVTLHRDPAHRGQEVQAAEQTLVVGASRDLSHVVLESPNNEVCAGAKGIKHGRVLCEWAEGSEAPAGESTPALSLLSVDSHGVLLNGCGATLGSGATRGGGVGNTHNAVSADGASEIFTVPDPEAKSAGPGCWNGSTEHAPQLYRRSGESTTEISLPEPGVSDPTCAVGEPACHPAIYVGASEDDSRVFFLSEGELTREAVTLKLHDQELYEFDTETSALTRISAGEPGHRGVTATGNLSAATGLGDITAGSAEIAAVTTTAGAFAVGQRLKAPGFTEGSTITAVGPGTLTVSRAASSSTSAAALAAGSTQVTALSTSNGSLEVGQEISGVGIPAGTMITALGTGALTLSAPATLAGEHVALNAGDPRVGIVPAIAASGSAVYFTAFAALTGGATAQPSTGQLVNVYRYDTNTNATSYVATVNTYDYPTAGGGCFNAFGTVDGPCGRANWYATPDGGALLFATSRELTGYDTARASELDCRTLPENGGGGNGHCDELYRYAAAGGGKLVCVSCNPSGALPTSNAEFSRSASGNPMSDVVHAMSADGSYAFFDTADALVPGDTNNSLDVYEWHEGHVALLSSGEDPAPSFFLGSSSYLTPSGSRVEGANVFIGTHARLVPQDTDASGDIYDARICVPEVPCIKQAVGQTAQCLGTSCQTPPADPPMTSPATLTLNSSGNLLGAILAPPKQKTAAQIKAERLAKALKQCKKDKTKRKRATCEAAARRKYGVVKKAIKKAKPRKKSHERRSK